MSRREVKMYVAFGALAFIATAGVMVGMGLLGVRDELTVIATIAVFGFTMFLGGALPSDPPPGRG
jgi:hypothetical protein